MSKPGHSFLRRYGLLDIRAEAGIHQSLEQYAASPRGLISKNQNIDFMPGGIKTGNRE